uniref:J domain-containing protein n=1 Tax=Rhabditophanes sp. KR3021 TaxID=114890 RepID=A0AC35TV02_9BILA
MALLAKGQLQDAVNQFQAAIDVDPNSYQAYYRKATVLLAMGRPDPALEDLGKVIALKPDFISATKQRASVYFKLCNLEKAENDFKTVSKTDKPEDSESKINLIHNVRVWIDYANKYFEKQDYVSAIPYYSKALEQCQWSAVLFRKRATCHEHTDEIQKAISDIRHLTKLQSDSREAYLEVSKLYYKIGDVESSLIQIRECLKLDPDDKACFAYYKDVKKLAKLRESLNSLVEKGKWMECLDKAKQILKFEKQNERIQLDVYKRTCKCNMKAGHSAEAIRECTEVLTNLDENDVEVIVDRAEAYILNEDYESAVNDYQAATKIDENSRPIKEGLHKAQKLLKQSKKRDYYKILAVKRNASKREVLKAYRKLAAKYHPDNFQDEAEKKVAEAKFLEIAAAKEVLSDEEKRAQYDSGTDPLDPEAQQGGHHGHPFGGGFNQHFQGGDFGGGFKFHFG